MPTDTAPPPAAPVAPPPDSFDIDVSDAFAPEPSPQPEPVPAGGSDDAPPADGQIDLADFKPKPVDLSRDAEPEPAPAAPPPEPKPGDTTPPGPKELRNAYETAKNERDALRAEKGEIEAAKIALEQEREQLRSQLGEATKHLSYRDPSTHPEVVAMQNGINREINDLPRTALMTSKQAEALKSQAPVLINEFRRIGEPSAEGYDTRRESFLTKVHDNFGDNGDKVSAVIAKAAQTMEQVERKMAEIKEMGGVNGYQEAKQRHDNIQADYATRYEANFFQVSPEFADANPYNSKVVLSNLVKSNPKMKAAADEIKKLIRKASIPPPPINPKELDSMPPAERDTMLRGRMQEHQKVIQHFASQSAEAQLAFLAVGPMMQRIAELEGQLKVKTGELISPRGGVPVPPPDTQIDVKDFKVGNVNLRG